MTTPRWSREKERADVAYVDPIHKGIVRFHEGADAHDGLLAGARAQQIVDALNFYAAAKARKGKR